MFTFLYKAPKGLPMRIAAHLRNYSFLREREFTSGEQSSTVTAKPSAIDRRTRIGES